MIRCITCGEESLNRYPLCNRCKPKQLDNNNRCIKCGILTSPFVEVCNSCRESSEELYNESLFMYRGLPKELIKLYKFSREVSLANYYAELLYDTITSKYKGFTICPIPTSYLKRRVKGWYQLDFIVHLLKKRSIPVSNLLGKRFGKTQKKLNREERLHNLKDVYYIKKGVFPEKILLFDDVYTTGVTLKSCYNILKPFCKTIRSLTLYRD